MKIRLSEILHAELERLDITVYELVKRSGLQPMTGRDIIAGASEPRVSALLALETGLGRPAGWLCQQLAGG